MRRLVLVAVAAALVAAPPAAAKDIRSAKVCGAHGCTEAGPLGFAGLALIPPDAQTPTPAPWYRLRLAMGEGHHVVQRYRVLWAPSIGMIAIDEPHPRWLAVGPRTMHIARRITRGVKPFPAATMPMDLPAAATSEVIGPSTRKRDRSAGGPLWLLLPVVGALAVVAAALLAYRSRRAKAQTASAPTTVT